jgi:hypothetical protein
MKSRVSPLSMLVCRPTATTRPTTSPPNPPTRCPARPAAASTGRGSRGTRGPCGDGRRWWSGQPAPTCAGTRLGGTGPARRSCVPTHARARRGPADSGAAVRGTPFAVTERGWTTCSCLFRPAPRRDVCALQRTQSVSGWTRTGADPLCFDDSRHNLSGDDPKCSPLDLIHRGVRGRSRRVGLSYQEPRRTTRPAYQLP